MRRSACQGMACEVFSIHHVNGCHPCLHGRHNLKSRQLHQRHPLPDILPRIVVCTPRSTESLVAESGQKLVHAKSDTCTHGFPVILVIDRLIHGRSSRMACMQQQAYGETTGGLLSVRQASSLTDALQTLCLCIHVFRICCWTGGRCTQLWWQTRSLCRITSSSAETTQVCAEGAR